MSRRFWDWLHNVVTTYQMVRIIGVVLAMVTPIGVIIREWVKGLDTVQLILLLIGLFGLLIVGMTYFWEWRTQRNIKYIPSLLLAMNEKMKGLIELAPYPQHEVLEKSCTDLAEIFNIDTVEIKKTIRLGRRVEIRRMFNTILLNRPNPVPEGSLHLLYQSLMDIQGIFDDYKIGLESIKDDQYKKLQTRFEALKRRAQLVPEGARIVKAITNYNNWWEGLSSFRLLLHYDSKYYIPTEILPPKVRAGLSNIQKQIEGVVTNLHADVLESMGKK
jgi:hypothetical protein